MNTKLRQLAPPGYGLWHEMRVFLWGLCFSILYSVGFVVRFNDARNGLYNFLGGKKTLLTDVLMPDMGELLGSALAGFLILALCMSATIFFRYAYFWQGSKSIYLMRRLPDKTQLHRRCLVQPLIACGLCLLAAFIMLLLYYGVYMFFTPKECLMPNQWQKLWSVIL